MQKPIRKDYLPGDQGDTDFWTAYRNWQASEALVAVKQPAPSEPEQPSAEVEAARVGDELKQMIADEFGVTGGSIHARIKKLVALATPAAPEAKAQASEAACGSYECKAAQKDGVLCADDECDVSAGERTAPNTKEALANNLAEQARKAGGDPVEIRIDKADLQLVLAALSEAPEPAGNVREALDIAHDLASEALNAAEVYKAYPAGSGLGRRYSAAMKDLECIKAARDALASQPPVAAVPEDFISHKASWRNALVLAAKTAPMPTEDSGEPGYWAHELRAFDRAYVELAATPTPAPAEPTQAARGEALIAGSTEVSAPGAALKVTRVDLTEAGKAALTTKADSIHAAHERADVAAQAQAGAVAWGIFDSQGLYDTVETETKAREFCEHYNKRPHDPCKPYTFAALFTRPAPAEAVALTPERAENWTRERVANLIRDEGLVWLGFDADEDGRFTIPVVSDAVLALVQAVARNGITPPPPRPPHKAG